MDFQKLVDDSVHRVRATYPPEAFRNKDFYANWLAQTYYFVRHSTSLLGFALPFLKDPKLRQVFEHHLGEESRHDLLALKDLEQLGGSIEAYAESACTQAFYQSQYYKIQFEGASSLLGYILFLEGLAVSLGKDVYDDVQKIFPKATLFLKVHAEEDVSHVARAVALVKALPAVDQEFIAQNLLYSQELYQRLLGRENSKMPRKVA